MPCHLSGLHDTAVSRPYGNNASAFGSMGRREAEREGGVGSRSCCIHSVSQSLRPPSHRDLPSYYPQNINTSTFHACGIGMVHMVVLIVYTYMPRITRLFNNAVSLTKVITLSNERGSSCVVDTGLKINGPDLFYDITSVSALKQYDTSG